MRGTIVTHGPTDMTVLKDPAESFGECITWVDDAWDGTEDYLLARPPLKESVGLDLDVTRSFSGNVSVHNLHRGFVVFVENGGSRWWIPKIGEHRAKILGHLGCMHGSNEFSLGRGSGYGALRLGFVGNRSTGEAEDKSCDGSPRKGISAIGSINVAN